MIIIINILNLFIHFFSLEYKNINQKTDSEKILFLNKHKLEISIIKENIFKEILSNQKKNENKKAIKKNGVLEVRLLNNKKIFLKDSKTKSDDIEQIFYTYFGYLKEIDFHVIKVQHYETGEFILINNKTGVQTKIWGIPKISPDKNHLAIASNSFGYDIMPSGIQMWHIQDNKLILEWELKGENWGADKLIWKNKNEFYFEKHFIEDELVQYISIKIDF